MDMQYNASRNLQRMVNIAGLFAVAVDGFCYIPSLVWADTSPVIGLLAPPAPFLIAAFYVLASLFRLFRQTDRSVTFPGIILTFGGMIPLFIVNALAGIIFWPIVDSAYMLNFA